MTGEAAERSLRAVTSWSRYAEVFAYDDVRGEFSLENPG
jgi:NitT/TauT family transport system ATP-binding protein